MSLSILLFFKKHNLNNVIDICYKSYKKDGQEKVLSFPQGTKYYRYYVQLEKEVDGYDKLILSKASEEYILAGGDINRLRIKFYPWPELVLPVNKSFKEYHDQWDSIHDVMIRYTIKDYYIYDNCVPEYESIVLNSIKKVPGNYNSICLGEIDLDSL